VQQRDVETQGPMASMSCFDAHDADFCITNHVIVSVSKSKLQVRPFLHHPEQCAMWKQSSELWNAHIGIFDGVSCVVERYEQRSKGEVLWVRRDPSPDIPFRVWRVPAADELCMLRLGVYTSVSRGVCVTRVIDQCVPTRGKETPEDEGALVEICVEDSEDVEVCCLTSSTVSALLFARTLTFAEESSDQESGGLVGYGGRVRPAFATRTLCDRSSFTEHCESHEGLLRL